MNWDQPSWWWRTEGTTGEWTKYKLLDSKYIEELLYPVNCRRDTDCSSKCDCKCRDINDGSDQQNVIVLPSEGETTTTHNFDFTLEKDVSTTHGTRDIRRMCGSPSNVKRFAQSSPIVLDVCVEGGTWAKSQTPCTVNTITDCGKDGGSCSPNSIPTDTRYEKEVGL